MTKNDFIKAMTEAVNICIDNPDRFGTDPQIKVNPATLYVVPVNGNDRTLALEYADEAIEQAAGAEGDAYESATDFQAAQNPDYYQLNSLLKVNSEGLTVVDTDAIRKIADTYRPVND